MATRAGKPYLNSDQAVEAILQGLCLVYPTETFMALGGDATLSAVGERVQEIKRRPIDKPLPVLIGDLSLLGLISAETDRTLRQVVAWFWPGPLSVLVRARKGLPAAIQDQRGWVAVRWTSHPLAPFLSRTSKCPLIATSANLSGRPPPTDSEQTDPLLLGRVQGVCPGHGAFLGRLPSTLVRLTGPCQLEILRRGAISPAELRASGLSVRERLQDH